jgi:hypothetical protein
VTSPAADRRSLSTRWRDDLLVGQVDPNHDPNASDGYPGSYSYLTIATTADR